MFIDFNGENWTSSYESWRLSNYCIYLKKQKKSSSTLDSVDSVGGSCAEGKWEMRG